MKKLSTERRAAVLSALVEGNSIASTCRMFGVNKITVLRLFSDAGTIAVEYHNEIVRELKTKRVQCDEIWSFVHCKDKNTPEHLLGVQGVGDTWVWTAIDADSKLLIEWEVGGRDSNAAHAFMRGVAGRLANRVQITTDGFKCYKSAIAYAFDGDRNSDYGICIKMYDDVAGEGKYSPGRCTGVELKPVWGNPDLNKCSTSFVERSNLTMRMGMRRYTRLTNGHSKKFDNHVAMTTIFFTHYNWCRKHQSLDKGTTPAMASGLTDRVWGVEELLALI